MDVEFDAVVIGAGFSGLYMLKHLRDDLGLRVRVYEAGGGVGGTWYWNRYPGARCDSESWIYCYSFDPELTQEWSFSERYPRQPEILKYLERVADKHDLRRDIQFDTKVEGARFDEDTDTWEVATADGSRVRTRFLISAVGCISAVYTPPFPGAGGFAGEEYHTGCWPHESVDFTGKRVAVIGTGASAVQAIPLIAEQATELTVFQRTANYVIPARHHPLDAEFVAARKAEAAELRKRLEQSVFGFDYAFVGKDLLDSTPEEIAAELDKRWEYGGFWFWLGAYIDPFFKPEANKVLADYMHAKVRERVQDPETAEKLIPKGYPFGVKRIPLDSGYLETYNSPHVHLVDIHQNPVAEITSRGVKLADGSEYEADALVYATGFDLMTGPLRRIEVRGREGVSLSEKWADGPHTYLGLTSAGFPNFFTLTGPQSPSVLSNMPISIEQHVQYVGRIITDLAARGARTIEPTEAAERAWGEHCQELVSPTLFELGDTTYMGANIPGKARVFTPYLGFVGPYRQRCDEIAAKDYEGFVFDGAAQLDEHSAAGAPA
ncbi:MAG TPA: NAD(P)/FAD-dependent oxidoreductase [Sporichthyaceae bacterium]|jgi:cyclohexanone monooxygenase|nr:NAD(P)/FAD-dependent oxidoreductase [Sporichthyaceae bacterium]